MFFLAWGWDAVPLAIRSSSTAAIRPGNLRADVGTAWLSKKRPPAMRTDRHGKLSPPT